MSDYLYIDPRGRRSGPYTEAELKLLSARGLLEPDGGLEIAGLSTSWRVADVPWLRSDPAAARTPTTGIADAPTAPPPDAPAGDPEARVTIPPMASQPTDPPPQPTVIPVAGEPKRPLGTPPASLGGVGSTDQPACSRTVYVLLAILPAFLGIFGIHNLVAGYFSRGIVMLVLSVFTFMGACMVVAPPCLCLGIPLWIVLFVLSVVEAITVTSDARGRAFV